PSYFSVSTEEVIISSEDVGTFLVRGGREVCVIPMAGVDDSRIRLSLVGVVMAFVLYQRGILVLHAATISLGGGAVAFLGESGFGKSTMAAALYKRGYNLFTDDVLPVDPDSDIAMVTSGFPQFKLHPEAAAALDYDPNSLHELHSSQEKLGCRVDNGFESGRLPLSCIYVLARGEGLKIERLQLSQGVIELVRHSYPTRAQHCGGAAHFQQCAKIANQVPMYRLVRPKELSLLPQIALLVEQHVLSVLNSQPYHLMDRVARPGSGVLRPVEAA
ncbi:MAG: hypothetical protein ND866_09190, partial [Pyrinomonadaceae bacterium]|nr:hypothetical protein [Pyrinomonadaceae bacterium]